MKYLKYILPLTIVLCFSTPSFAIFGLFRHGGCNTCYTPNVVVVQNQIVTQTKLIIPVRQEQYSEVKGLRILSDLQNNKFIEVNGRILNVGSHFIEDTKEIIKGDKIIVEQVTTQTF